MNKIRTKIKKMNKIRTKIKKMNKKMIKKVNAKIKIKVKNFFIIFFFIKSNMHLYFIKIGF